MKLLVCFKVVNDIDTVMKQDWAEATLDALDISYTRRVLNSFDESALEMALGLKDEDPGGTELTALTVDAPGARLDATAQELYAVGFDRVVRLAHDGDLRFVPGAVAGHIAAFAQTGNFDVVLLGDQAGAGDNGQTGPLVAELLGRPCVTGVVAAARREGALQVESRTDGGMCRLLAKPPLVLAVGNARRAYMRAATLKERLASKKRELHTLEASGFVLPAPADAQVQTLWHEAPARTAAMIQGDGPAEKARQLYTCYIKEALSK